jgi:diguanylate cyclase (GGDEF)-like protein
MDEPPTDDETAVIKEWKPLTPPEKGGRDQCALIVLQGSMPGTMFTVTDEQAVLGRSSKLSARIDDRGISRRHARVFRSGDAFFTEDLGSTNGTFLNGEPVSQPQKLKDGDRIQLGQNVVIQVQMQDAFEKAATQKLYESAVKAPLTQVYNRRYLQERLRTEYAFAVRHGTELSLLILDIDHFKKVNDTYGHQAGDEVLKAVGDVLMRMLRAEDVVARYGGEEFSLIARGIAVEGALTLAERVRAELQQMAVPWKGGTLRITVSVGAVTQAAEHKFESQEAFMAAADQALYRAKAAGRNRCYHAAQLSPK